MTLTHYRDIQNYFYITVQRTMGGRKKEENPKQLLSYWKEEFIKHKKGTPKTVFLTEVPSISPQAYFLL